MYIFKGKWITDREFSSLEPRNIFHRHIDKVDIPCDEHRNCHILFRKKFDLKTKPQNAKIYISADDYYKLYINGKFAGQGPAPAYHFEYNYNVIDISEFLQSGENTIAVHTLYQGLINRVWQSGDNRHGLILDLLADGEAVLCSDTSFKTCRHSAYSEMGTTAGFHQTQFLESYDSNAREAGFEKTEFDDSYWENALTANYANYGLKEQKTSMLVFEKIKPVKIDVKPQKVIYDFGSNYVGYFSCRAKGKKGSKVIVRCAQELNDDGSLRFKLRSGCNFEEDWILSDGESVLEWYDYKAFRYVELEFDGEAAFEDAHIDARHYPFELKGKMKPEYKDNEALRSVWDLCVHTLEYGVQEVIQDCMDREKGFYLGDGCYSVLAHMIATKDDSMARKLINDAFSSSFVSDGLLTCMDCSRMHEIAEFPLIMLSLILWHYRLMGDREYLEINYEKGIKLLESYRKSYEENCLLSNLDKWCVVEWPINYRDNYDVDITENEICREPHVSLNAYYINAVKTMNKIAQILGREPYRDTQPLTDAFFKTFYNKEKHLFKDGRDTEHISMVGNAFPFGFGLYPDEQFKTEYLKLLKKNKISYLSFFTAFVTMSGLCVLEENELLKECLTDDGAWLRMLREDATTIFEGWGKDVKWNTSLFHMTFTYGAVFLADINHKELFGL